YGVLVNREKAPIPKGKAVPRASIKDFSKVGTPNYQVYFDYIDHLDLHADIVPGLPMETSRGCWWGAIQHCTFCAFHENGLSYQAKPAERVLEEWAAMAKKYNHRNIMVVDAILPHEYFETLLPKLAEMGAPYQLFFEIKSNLKQHQVELLAKAGVRWLQPGIESVHDEALAAVKKGVKGIHNVATLKWARAYGIHIAWNVLHGMPLEEDHWYSDMAKIFPSLTHLSPPNGLTSILFQRNSPYFDQSEQYGLELHAAPGYGQVFPLPQQELDRLAYHFHAQDSFRRSARTKASEAKTILADELNTWKALWEREYPPILYQVEREGRICIWDTRPVTEQDYFTKTGIEADLLKICDTPQLAKNVYKKAMERNSGYSESQIEEALHLLQEEHLVLGISGRYISLPVSGPMPFPDKRLLYPGGIVRYYRS
ncbi:MAG TPA: hypothetical protein DCR93_11995, partial [Cytophagales bacterium]|nr:hypothetical protein [Cytophagales bacterium]